MSKEVDIWLQKNSNEGCFNVTTEMKVASMSKSCVQEVIAGM